MCGIVGAVSKRNVVELLLEGLKRLEYRGYDSAGVAIINDQEKLARCRTLGKVSVLEDALKTHQLAGHIGVAHTRWATHGKPCENNAHPHLSDDSIAVVHNGIIENHQALKSRLQEEGYVFTSDTDTEVIVHLVHFYYQKSNDLLNAVNDAAKELEGAFAVGVIHQSMPDTLVALRRGSPLVVGIGFEENFIASDPLALHLFAKEIIYLEEDDLTLITNRQVTVYDKQLNEVQRAKEAADFAIGKTDKGQYRHFMLKEIYDQQSVLAETLQGRVSEKGVLVECFGEGIDKTFEQVKHVQIIACGTSYHAGLVAKYWIEHFSDCVVSVEVASEYRYRSISVPEKTLFVTISQSGETADTLAALRLAKEKPYLASLAICNVPTSTLVRESDSVFLTRAGTEIGVASTKAFTTQLCAFFMLAMSLSKDGKKKEAASKNLLSLPNYIDEVLALDKAIQTLSEDFIEKHNALFLGRGASYPIALEGALKLKEISYIHAEAYPAGELKHGPLALVDAEMPVIVVAPCDDLIDKLRSNLQEVHARGGKLYVFADKSLKIDLGDDVKVIALPSVPADIAPIIYTIPLQLLAYHVAVLKGTDVDQPRNLAKSVTVE